MQFRQAKGEATRDSYQKSKILSGLQLKQQCGVEMWQDMGDLQHNRSIVCYLPPPLN